MAVTIAEIPASLYIQLFFHRSREFGQWLADNDVIAPIKRSSLLVSSEIKLEFADERSVVLFKLRWM